MLNYVHALPGYSKQTDDVIRVFFNPKIKCVECYGKRYPMAKIRFQWDWVNDFLYMRKNMMFYLLCNEIYQNENAFFINSLCFAFFLFSAVTPSYEYYIGFTDIGNAASNPVGFYSGIGLPANGIPYPLCKFQ